MEFKNLSNREDFQKLKKGDTLLIQKSNDEILLGKFHEIHRGEMVVFKTEAYFDEFSIGMFDEGSSVVKEVIKVW